MDDQQAFDQLFEKTRRYADAANSFSRQFPFETMLVSMLIEQEKALAELKSRLKEHDEKGR